MRLPSKKEFCKRVVQKKKETVSDALSGGLADTFEKLGAMPGYEGTNIYN